MFQFRSTLSKCSIILVITLCQIDGTVQQVADTTETIANVDILKEELTRLVLSPMLNKFKEVDRKLDEIKLATEKSKQDTEQMIVDVIRSSDQQVIDLSLNLSNTFQQLKLKQDVVLQNLSKYALYQDLYFEAVKPQFGPVLINAVKNGKPERVLGVLELGAPIEFEDSESNRPIHKATENIRTEILKILLDQGADANSHGKYGYTPLHWTSFNGCVECARILLAKGAYVDSRDNWEDTPLIKSAKYGYDDLVKLLLENKADVNAVQASRYSALHMAARDGRISTVAILVRHGANLSLKTTESYTALDYATKNKHYEIVSFLKNEMNETMSN